MTESSAAAIPPATGEIALDQILCERFGWQAFRPLQRELIECVLAGESALGVLPTGGGKSLCYQLPALLLPGVTLVISPLISLMKDQVDAITARGFAAVAINSQDTLAEMHRKLADMKAGRARIVYVAPERLKNGNFMEVCRQVHINLLAVDEAHCVSQWGHDFRPDYRFIKDFRSAVGEPPLLALTATATRRVQQDIVTHLGIATANRFLAEIDRSNLWLGLEHCQSIAEKQGKIVALAARAPGSVIVYVSSRRDADELAGMLEEALGELVAAYHAGMAPADRTAVQNRFMTGLVRIVTATNAFGMGIDKPDIRAVIHAGVPESIEAYFQEVGRAGRDGEPAECTMVVVPGRDVKMRQYLLEKDEMTRAQLDGLLQAVSHLAATGEGLVPVSEENASLFTLILSYLQNMGQLELVQRMPAGMRVAAVRPLAPGAADQVWTQAQQHIRAKQERFRFMRNFVYLDGCRRRFLLTYFGEKAHSQPEACCSSCHSRPVTARPLPQTQSALPKPKRKQVISAPAETAADPALLQQLKAWRREKALARDVPAYVIFGDKDLAGIAAAAPSNLDELAACRGIGPAKLELYGEEILAILSTAPRPQREAKALFAAGRTLAEAAATLRQPESVVWEYFLTWITRTADDIWKEQVRRHLRPDQYLAIRAELRGRLAEPFARVLEELQQRFGYREITLTRAVMERVGEK